MWQPSFLICLIFHQIPWHSHIPMLTCPHPKSLFLLCCPFLSISFASFSLLTSFHLQEREREISSSFLCVCWSHVNAGASIVISQASACFAFACFWCFSPDGYLGSFGTSCHVWFLWVNSLWLATISWWWWWWVLLMIGVEHLNNILVIALITHECGWITIIIS